MSCKSPPSLLWSIVGEMLALMITIWVLTVVLPALKVVTPAYRLWLPLGIQVAWITAILHLLALFFGQGFLSRLFRFCASVVALYSFYVFMTIFPLNFTVIGLTQLNQWLQLIFSFAFLISLVVIAVKFIRLFL